MPGVPNRIYFEALTDHDGTDVAEFMNGELVLFESNSTEGKTIVSGIKPKHIGRGYFDFTPEILKDGEFYMFKAKWNRA